MHKDDTCDAPIRQFPFAPVMVIPLAQHFGNPSRPIVREGQEVQRGECLGEADGDLSVATHAPASGVVQRIDLVPGVAGKMLPGIYLRGCEGGRLDVATRNGRQIVGVHDTLDVSALRTGDELYLDPETGVAISRAEAGPQVGAVAQVAECLGDRLMVRGESGEERAVLCDPELADAITVGDRVMLCADVPCVIERLPSRSQSSHLLTETSTRVSRSREQSITRTFRNPYIDRTLELRFMPAFRRFEVTTTFITFEYGLSTDLLGRVV